MAKEWPGRELGKAVGRTVLEAKPWLPDFSLKDRGFGRDLRSGRQTLGLGLWDLGLNGCEFRCGKGLCMEDRKGSGKEEVKRLKSLKAEKGCGV